METLTIKIVELGLTDIERIIADEKLSFPPFLQASEDTIRLRIALGHIMLGAEVQGKLIGKICFSYGNFSLERDGFPADFRGFSTQPLISDYNAAFIYNLNIQPMYRGSRTVYKLIEAMIQKVKENGGRYLVLDGRPASYASRPKVKSALDGYLETGEFPTDRELCRDPTLAFYHRLGGRFLWIMPNFLPEDTPAGGFRVIMLKEL